MAKYTLKEAVEIEGVNHAAGEEVELTDEVAAQLGDKVEKVADQGAADQGAGDQGAEQNTTANPGGN